MIPEGHSPNCAVPASQFVFAHAPKQFPIECSNCGHMYPDGLCEVCKPVVGSSYPIPSTDDLLIALRVISHWQVMIAVRGGIHLVDDIRTDTEAAVEQARLELRNKRNDDR